MTKRKKNDPEILEDDVLVETPVAETPVEETTEATEADASIDDENGEDSPDKILKEIVKEDEQILNRLIRLQADFENFKKRTQKEKSDIYQFASENLATKLLPVIDNLERAEASIEGADVTAESFLNGIQMVFKQLKEVLKEEGLEEIVCEGAFDPNYHHGVAVGEDDEKDDQDIMEVFQKGYSFKGKVIRPAMVKVCNK
ncbi:nucleotide exchange factor GrpE [Acetobacterium bakii]|uniref:nucleotide exchange factor GrpE n=1 Tax=Acetobacterium bakii TaxID=52689 RepID=UPI0006819818|nr:nucleotide exchange factor GrpE [Acetobacterium bakii]